MSLLSKTATKNLEALTVWSKQRELDVDMLVRNGVSAIRPENNLRRSRIRKYNITNTSRTACRSVFDDHGFDHSVWLEAFPHLIFLGMMRQTAYEDFKIVRRYRVRFGTLLHGQVAVEP